MTGIFSLLDYAAHLDVSQRAQWGDLLVRSARRDAIVASKKYPLIVHRNSACTTRVLLPSHQCRDADQGIRCRCFLLRSIEEKHTPTLVFGKPMLFLGGQLGWLSFILLIVLFSDRNGVFFAQPATKIYHPASSAAKRHRLGSRWIKQLTADRATNLFHRRSMLMISLER